MFIVKLKFSLTKRWEKVLHESTKFQKVKKYIFTVVISGMMDINHNFFKCKGSKLSLTFLTVYDVSRENTELSVAYQIPRTVLHGTPFLNPHNISAR